MKYDIRSRLWMLCRSANSFSHFLCLYCPTVTDFYYFCGSFGSTRSNYAPFYHKLILLLIVVILCVCLLFIFVFLEQTRVFCIKLRAFVFICLLFRVILHLWQFNVGPFCDNFV